MEITERIKEEYLTQDLGTPKYIFHGSNNLLPQIEPHQAHDASKTGYGNQFAVYGTTLPLVATLFALTPKDCSSEINITPDISKLKTIIYNCSIPEDTFGYVHVCDAANFNRCGEGYQWVRYQEVKPIEVIKVHFNDFKRFFEFTEMDREEVNKLMGK